jgi:hypothetical protein
VAIHPIRPPRPPRPHARTRRALAGTHLTVYPGQKTLGGRGLAGAPGGGSTIWAHRQLVNLGMSKTGYVENWVCRKLGMSKIGHVENRPPRWHLLPSLPAQEGLPGRSPSPVCGPVGARGPLRTPHGQYISSVGSVVVRTPAIPPSLFPMIYIRLQGRPPLLCLDPAAALWPWLPLPARVPTAVTRTRPQRPPRPRGRPTCPGPKPTGQFRCVENFEARPRIHRRLPRLHAPGRAVVVRVPSPSPSTGERRRPRHAAHPSSSPPRPPSPAPHRQLATGRWP